MKKIIVFLFALSIVFINKKQNIVIPQESIRFRIVANSDSKEDQELKWKVNQKIIPILNDITLKSNNISDSRQIINNNISKLKSEVSYITNDYQINYGMNYFPPKTYNDVEYPEGNYESLMITLGSGEGQNWWCVLFPPLCLLEANKTNLDKVEYKFYIKDIIKKYI